MADINKLKPKILKWEGGYANDPDDAGGCTMKGITIATFRRYFGSCKTCSDLRNITDSQWMWIFKKGYWDKMRADEIENQSIADLCVQMGWGSGPITAIKKIQKCLGLTADGVVGPKTLGALNGPNKRSIFNKLWNMRKAWLINISMLRNNRKFINGWLRRLNDYEFEE